PAPPDPPTLSLHDALPILSGLPQEGIDAGPGKTTFVAKPGIIFLADCDQQCLGWTDNFRRWRPPTLHAPQQCLNGCARNLVPARDRKSTRLNSSHVKISYA